MPLSALGERQKSRAKARFFLLDRSCAGGISALSNVRICPEVVKNIVEPQAQSWEGYKPCSISWRVFRFVSGAGTSGIQPSEEIDHAS